jgi:hypothetical protein
VPALEGGKLGSIPACPLSMVTASLDRRTGKSLSGIVKMLLSMSAQHRAELKQYRHRSSSFWEMS